MVVPFETITSCSRTTTADVCDARDYRGDTALGGGRFRFGVQKPLEIHRPIPVLDPGLQYGGQIDKVFSEIHRGLAAVSNRFKMKSLFNEIDNKIDFRYIHFVEAIVFRVCKLFDVGL